MVVIQQEHFGTVILSIFGELAAQLKRLCVLNGLTPFSDSSQILRGNCESSETASFCDAVPQVSPSQRQQALSVPDRAFV